MKIGADGIGVANSGPHALRDICPHLHKFCSVIISANAALAGQKTLFVVFKHGGQSENGGHTGVHLGERHMDFFKTVCGSV